MSNVETLAAGPDSYAGNNEAGAAGGRCGPHPVDIHVGARLRELRRKSGLSKAEVARQLGVETSQLTKYERAENRLPAAKLWDVARCFGIQVESLFPRTVALPTSGPLDGYWRTEEGQGLLAAFRAASPEMKRSILDLVHSLAGASRAS